MPYKLLLSIFSICTFINITSAQDSYFQQEVNYKINVTLNDSKHTLSAHIEIDYHNNSPQELSEIYFHLWPNAYKNNSTALAKQLLENGKTNFYYSNYEDRGFIDSLDFKVNDNSVQLIYDEKHVDVAKIILNEPLKSGQSIKISTPFFVKIPKGIYSRLGHIEESYQITQWYPKPAVYDKNGWNAMPYLNQGEFYSEYGSYDVSINLPKNYLVGATGDLYNSDNEIKWLDSLSKETELLKEFPLDDNFPVSSIEYKTLHYKQSQVHDFAWFADKRWNVLKGEVELPHSKRKVTLWAMFTNSDAKLWKKSIEYLHDAVYYYSLWNGDYPYNQVTAVDGALSAGGGMEYPNVTVIGSVSSSFLLEKVIMHEVGHNWFYGILGSNERTHPWMDEGINSFNEFRYIETKYPNAWLDGDSTYRKITKIFDIDYLKHKAQYELSYLFNARREYDQPIELHSAEYSNFNYGGIVYSKSAIVFDYLMAYLGQEIFDKAMQTYFEKWKFKHPDPEDLKKIFIEVTGKELNWFFDDIIKTTGKIDYKITSKRETTNEIIIELQNVGDIASPVSISALKNGTILHTKWVDGFVEKKEISFQKTDYDLIKIDVLLDIPEINRKNNTIKSSGLFKKIEPIKFQFLTSVENPDKTQICYTPTYAWNNYNKSMLGLAFYNIFIPQKKFEYFLSPFFSLETKKIVGLGNLSYNFFRNDGIFHNIRISTSAQKFAYSNYTLQKEYTKITQKIEFEFNPSNARSKISKEISLRSVNVIKQNEIPVYYDGIFQNYSIENSNNQINELTFEIIDAQILHPKNLKATIEHSHDFVKTSIEANYRINYKEKKKGVDIRIFAGKFLYNNNANEEYKFSINGNNDYLFDHFLFGRSDNDGIWSKQFAMKDGGFKNLALIQNSDNWLASLNVQIASPFKLPIAFYGDLGILDYKNTAFDSYTNIVWNTGIALTIIPKMFEIYFPLAMSSDLNQLKYADKIRFVLNINSIKPSELLRKINI